MDLAAPAEGMELRSVRLERFKGVGDDGQVLIFNPDQLAGTDSSLVALGDDERHLIADEPYLIGAGI